MRYLLIFGLLLCVSNLVNAQIYECPQSDGRRVWSDQPCDNATILHPGVSESEQSQAEKSDQQQRQQRAKDAQANAQRNRSAQKTNRASSRASSTKNIELCTSTQRSLRIQRGSVRPNEERIKQLTADEKKYC